MNEVYNLFNFLSPNILLIQLSFNEIMDYSNKPQKKFNTNLTAEFPQQ